MKKIICMVLFITTISTQCAPPWHDMPHELKNYDNRLPEFITNFYNNIKVILHEVKQNLGSVPQLLYQVLITHHEHYNDTAYVRYSEHDDICKEEQAFIKKRFPHVKRHLEKFLDVSLQENKVPRIGIVLSGGGFRAMLMSLGFLSGAEKIGLLDSTFYCAGLSGSTWALAPWIASGKKLQDYTATITSKLAGGIDHINETYELSELLQIVVTKLLSKQLVSTMDIYGGIIANTLLKGSVKNPLTITLTDAHKQVVSGKMPMPIYTAIQSYRDPYEWMEFTPFEIGSSFLKSYIPTWAYGRKFKDGVSKNTAPEQTLGYFMGIFGSAFEVNLKDLVRLSIIKLSALRHQLPDVLAQALKKCFNLILDSFIGEMRLFPSMLANFTYLQNSSPVSQEKTIALVDAGIDFSLPIPPLLRAARNVDIIIVYDASAGDLSGGPDLKCAARYAQRYGMKFPPVSEQVGKEKISILRDPTDPTVPVVVYFPRVKNEQFNPTFDPQYCIEEEYCNTFNFKYKPEEARLLCDFAEFIIKDKKTVVQQVIKDVLKTKFGYTKFPSTKAQEAYA